MTQTPLSTIAAMDLTGPRPQPLGVLPWPAGMLVLPGVEGASDLCAALVEGRTPEDWPEALLFLAAALEGDVVAAASLVHGEDVVARHNRAVLVGARPEEWADIAADATGELRAVIDSARFSVGAVDLPPDPAGATGEIAAIVASARASAALEHGDAESAVTELERGSHAARAAGSDILATSLGATRVELLRDALRRPAEAVTVADHLLRSLPAYVPAEMRAELHLSRALARQELVGEDRMGLMVVVADLQEALKTFQEHTHPELWATCNQHLALAYLVLPMGDNAGRLRLGVAVTSLRGALRVLRPETHPVAWASAQVNLANALQWLPSVHQADNLDEAVQLYEEVLAYRDERSDPVGVARILTNQGNALGHLGAFDDADERLGRARELFSAVGDDSGVATADDLLAEVAAARTRVGG